MSHGAIEFKGPLYNITLDETGVMIEIAETPIRNLITSLIEDEGFVSRKEIDSRPKPKVGERCKECAWMLQTHSKEDVIATCAHVIKGKTRRKKG